jgi:hypothetical protein
MEALKWVDRVTEPTSLNVPLLSYSIFHYVLDKSLMNLGNLKQI